MLLLRLAWGFASGSALKNLPAMHKRWTGDAGLIPGSGRSPGEGNGKTLQNPNPWGRKRVRYHWAIERQQQGLLKIFSCDFFSSPRKL